MAGTAEIARENGKKGGRPKGFNAINAEKAKEALIKAYLERVNPINKALLDKAESGDIQAIKELHDRVYGKANQAIDMKGEVEVRIIKLDV